MTKLSKIIILTESRFWWDSFTPGTFGINRPPPYRAGNYLPLETIDDLIDQFNYVGFNDLCIYPPMDNNHASKDLALYRDPSLKYTKGIWGVYYGHTNQNQTGK